GIRAPPGRSPPGFARRGRRRALDSLRGLRLTSDHAGFRSSHMNTGATLRLPGGWQPASSRRHLGTHDLFEPEDQILEYDPRAEHRALRVRRLVPRGFEDQVLDRLTDALPLLEKRQSLPHQLDLSF